MKELLIAPLLIASASFYLNGQPVFNNGFGADALGNSHGHGWVNGQYIEYNAHEDQMGTRIETGSILPLDPNVVEHNYYATTNGFSTNVQTSKLYE